MEIKYFTFIYCVFILFENKIICRESMGINATF